MSQGFKLIFDQMRQNIPATLHPSPGENELTASSKTECEITSARNLRLIWLDGRETFLNYAYLVEAEFSPGDDVNEILLNFSGYLIRMKGFVLQPLFLELFEHLPKTIFEDDPRYLPSSIPPRPFVTEICVTYRS